MLEYSLKIVVFNDDISISWNKQDDNLLVTGGSDHFVKIVDIRMIRNKAKTVWIFNHLDQRG